MSDWPSVGVVLPTRDRPVLLRAALASVLGQDYPGQVQVIVVHDRAEVDHSLADRQAPGPGDGQHQDTGPGRRA